MQALKDCKNEEERRENWPELCEIADSIEELTRVYPEAAEVAASSVLWIIQERKREAAQQ